MINLQGDNARRGFVLVLGVIIALASGSNYVYSAYAPQLAARLNISSTQVNLIGMAGNLGMYTSGPIWGKLIDARGPRLPLLLAFVLQFVGYYGIRLFYTRALVMDAVSLAVSPGTVETAAQSRHLSALGLLCLAVFMCMTGFGSTAGLSSAINTVAKSFPDHARATATGITIAGFGLSAFLFSTLSHSLFPGDVSSFLLLLAVGTSLPMLMSAFVLRAVRPAGPDAKVAESGWGRVSGVDGGEYEAVPGEEDDEDKQGDARGPVVHIRTPSPSPSPSRSKPAEGRSSSVDLERSQAENHRPRHHASSHELSPRRGLSPPALASYDSAEAEVGLAGLAEEGELGATVRDRSVAPSVRTLGVNEVDIYGAEMVRQGDFWLICVILVLLSGTGLCWINNVGSVTLALLSEGNPDYDLVEVAKFQAVQVSVISIWNCLGRVSMGMITDFAKTRLRLRRIWFLCLTSSIFIISQISAQRVRDVTHLWRVSATLGFGYGTMFSLLPIVILEWFGLAHFAQNWGFVSMAPAVGGNLANFMFGRIYDSHVAPPVPSLEAGLASNATTILLKRGASLAGHLVSRGGGMIPNDHSHDCLIGQRCYLTALRITTFNCCVALCLSVLAGIRRERQSRARKRAAWAEEVP